MRRHCAALFVAGVLVVAALPAHAVVLRFRPQVGTARQYKLTMSGRMTMEMAGVGEAMRTETTAEVEYREKALSREDDLTRYETELLGGKVNMTLGERIETMDVPTGRFVADMDSRGRLVKMVETEFEGETPQQPFMGSGAESMPASFHYAPFPEGDVKEGDTWSDTIAIPTAPDGPELEMTFTSELLALTTFQGRKCAKIRTSFNAPMDMDLEDLGAPAGSDESGTIEAALKGDILMYYDYDNSLYVYGEGTVGMDMNMSMEIPEMPAGNMTMKMITNVKMVMTE